MAGALARSILPEVAVTLERPLFFLLLGDSITQQSFSPEGGWGATLADTYIRKADVVNKGFSGYTTRSMRFALKRVLESAGVPTAFKPDFATIFLGANDAALPNSISGQHIPVQDYKENLRFIANEIRDINPDVKLIFITPPPLDDVAFLETAKTKWGDEIDGPNRTHTVTGRYASACELVANAVSIPCFNLYRDMQDPAKSPLLRYVENDLEPKWQSYLKDGLHLSPSGNKFVANGLLGLMKESYPELDPDELPLFLPPFTQIDHSKGEDGFAHPGSDCT
uniref:SGNH hydrolase-type esterase domain-containing protein n=1 Tax=Palpitomonas bilix TaxID=652834 RepID=A0A7S3GFC1_9EUKA|mmetsp:Transcript_46874/g.120808  ORF Transcript_46874/g.120808 Transcript_46874/m.120808 type:complete len:281 (+) Transcript_46874:169-1011(+)